MFISIIIPTHNRADLLRDAIESVLSQEPWEGTLEIIVVNDASNDNTAEIVAKYPSVRYFETNQQSAGGARNIGIQQAKGDWLAFLDDDDVFLPHKLKKVSNAILQNATARMFYSSAWICDHKLTKGWIWQGPNLNRYSSCWEAFLDDVVSVSMVVINKEIFEKTGLFDTDLKRAQDRDMWLRIVEAGYIPSPISEPLILYRSRIKESSKLLLDSWKYNTQVLDHHISSIKYQPLPFLKKSRIYWKMRGWYADRLVQLAIQEKKENNKQEAKRIIRIAMHISLFHTMKRFLLGR